MVERSNDLGRSRNSMGLLSLCGSSIHENHPRLSLSAWDGKAAPPWGNWLIRNSSQLLVSLWIWNNWVTWGWEGNFKCSSKVFLFYISRLSYPRHLRTRRGVCVRPLTPCKNQQWHLHSRIRAETMGLLCFHKPAVKGSFYMLCGDGLRGNHKANNDFVVVWVKTQHVPPVNPKRRLGDSLVHFARRPHFSIEFLVQQRLSTFPVQNLLFKIH